MVTTPQASALPHFSFFGLDINLSTLSGLFSHASTFKSLIAQALTSTELQQLVEKAMPWAVPYLEAWGEKAFPKVAPALRIAAAVAMAYDHDGTRFVQKGINALRDADPRFASLPHLDVDGAYGNQTIASVTRLQEIVVQLGLAKLHIDGFAGSITQGLLQGLLNNLVKKIAA